MSAAASSYRRPTGAERQKWLGSKAGMWSLLAGATAVMSMFMFGRRRPRRFEPMPKHKFDWRGCGVDGCGKLVSPNTLMCPEHWIQVPPTMRMRLRAAQRRKEVLSPRGGARPVWTNEVTELAIDAIRFVEAEETARVHLQRTIRYPNTAELWRTIQRVVAKTT